MSDPSLIGTWSLRHFELRFPDGRVTHPFGEAVSGYLFYNEDGFMSAAFGSAARCAGSSQDLAKVAQREAGGFDEFMAYCGRYEVKVETSGDGPRIVLYQDGKAVASELAVRPTAQPGSSANGSWLWRDQREEKMYRLFSQQGRELYFVVLEQS